MIITTTPLIQGYDIVNYHGLLSANQVIGANFFSDLFAGITDTLGGFSGSYRSQLDELYNDIINTITNKAEAIGANAIIGLHVDLFLQFLFYLSKVLLFACLILIYKTNDL